MRSSSILTPLLVKRLVVIDPQKCEIPTKQEILSTLFKKSIFSSKALSLLRVLHLASCDMMQFFSNLYKKREDQNYKQTHQINWSIILKVEICLSCYHANIYVLVGARGRRPL
jgi:hypothetical protein